MPGHDLGTYFGHHSRQPANGFLFLHVVEVTLKSIAQTEVTVEHSGADNRGGFESSLAGDSCQRGHLVIQNESTDIANLVNLRVRAGQNRSVGRCRQRNLGYGLRKTNPRCGQCIDVGSGNRLFAVAGKIVSTESIDRNENDIGVAKWRLPGRCLTWRGTLGASIEKKCEEERCPDAMRIGQYLQGKTTPGSGK